MPRAMSSKVEWANMTQITEWLSQHGINVVGTVVILIAASIITLLVRRLLRRSLTHLQGRLSLTYETNLIIGRVITAILWILAIFIILNIWGIGLGGVWTVLVSVITLLGVAFLATWSIVSNFMASFFLVLWRPFQFGQTVEIFPENVKGRVTDQNLLFTTSREESGNILQIPNNFFFQKMFRVSDHTERTQA